jgi:hypothetical protein
MKAKRTAGGAAATGRAAARTPAGDLPRQQMAVLAEGTTAMLRGLKAMQKIQEDAARRGLERYRDAAGKLGRPGNAADLMAIQAELLRADAEGVAEYWTQMSAAALETQVELISCCARLMDSGAVLKAAPALGAIPALPRDFDAYFHGNARSEAS